MLDKQVVIPYKDIPSLTGYITTRQLVAARDKIALARMPRFSQRVAKLNAALKTAGVPVIMIRGAKLKNTAVISCSDVLAARGEQ